MGKYAVVIGLNYPDDPDNSLRGPCNDARAVQKFLRKRGFSDKNIKLLVDDCDKRCVPDIRRVRKALNSLCSCRRSGDTIFLHFSGHGTQLEDLDGDEEDGLDEAIVLHDFDLLVDDELKTYFCKLPAGVRATVIVDSCHSGTMLDSKTVVIGGEQINDEPALGGGNFGGYRTLRVSGTRYRKVRAIPATRIAARLSEKVGWKVSPTNESIAAAKAAISGKETPKFHASNTAVNEDVCMAISGCQPHEISMEVEFNGVPHGVLTYFVLAVASENRCISNYDLVLQTRKGAAYVASCLARQNIRMVQNPCLESSESLAQKRFLSSKPPSKRSAPCGNTIIYQVSTGYCSSRRRCT